MSHMFSRNSYILLAAAVLLAVLLGAQLDLLTGTQMVRNCVIMFFIVNDGFSIIENLGIMGLPLPDGLKNAFEALRDKKV